MDTFLKKIQKQFPKEHQIILKALQFATKKHLHQKRAHGQPFITHPIAVADILMRWEQGEVDSEVIMAALLHDVLEDTNTQSEELIVFGERTKLLVEYLTHPAHASTKRERDELHFEKIQAAAKKDKAVLLIKIADRLHNSLDKWAPSPKRLHEVSLLTQDKYIPLAREYGFIAPANELESAIKDCITQAKIQKKIHEQNKNNIELTWQRKPAKK